jgi:hypothetical protein
MARRIVMDEFHLTVYAPGGLSAPEYEAIRRALDEPELHAALARAARRVLRRSPPLRPVRVRLSR